jgi:hypothetical protein
MKRKKESLPSKPSQTTLLMQAIQCDNEQAVKLLVKKAMLLSSPSSQHWPKENAWSDADVDAIVSLICGIKPRDMIEALLAVQVISLHLKGISTMAQDNYNIMGPAMQMVRLSHQALNMLQQYRGKSQTINVNYNVHAEGDSVINTLVQAGIDKKMGG